MNMSDRIVIISKKKHFDFLNERLPSAELTEVLPSGQGCKLVCFGTGLIVPENVLNSWLFKLNFHAAPASYPGRDPHHWAAYDKTTCYGATLHDMTPSVDAGTIHAQILFGVTPCLTPTDYSTLGEVAMRALFDCWSQAPAVLGVSRSLKWTGIKKSRSDLIRMCDFRGLSEDEKALRSMAFSGFEKHFIYDD